MGLGKSQPQPRRWCMQVPSHEMQVAGPEPLVPWHPTEGHHWSPTCPPPATCIGFTKEERGGEGIPKRCCGPGEDGGGLMPVGGVLPTEVESGVRTEGKQCM